VRADPPLHLWPREPSDSKRKRKRKRRISLLRAKHCKNGWETWLLTHGSPKSSNCRACDFFPVPPKPNPCWSVPRLSDAPTVDHPHRHSPAPTWETHMRVFVRRAKVSGSVLTSSTTTQSAHGERACTHTHTHTHTHTSQREAWRRVGARLHRRGRACR
jgi:hypothetical protein